MYTYIHTHTPTGALSSADSLV